ncbi:MAG: hypothetical protein HW401_250 [Parcubacteria group bacterium]|nr:hypothetical protein [Parcubacteria group bacterium]
MNNKNIFESKNLRRILWGVGIAIAILLIFQAGMFVGYRKASFSYRWGNNYYRAFGEHRGGERMMGGRMMDSFRGKDFTNSSGAIGRILSINLPTLAIENGDGIEKIILIADDTSIKRFRETINVADLKIGDFVVVIGAPNDSSQVEAKIVRVMPNPENFIGTSARANLKNK